MAAQPSGEASARCTTQSRSGMPIRNRTAPEMRWRIETIAGTGCRICVKSRKTGRGLVAGRSSVAIGLSILFDVLTLLEAASRVKARLLCAATNYSSASEQLIHVMVFARNAKPFANLHRALAVGQRHAIDREQRLARLDAENARRGGVGGNRADLLFGLEHA